MGDRVLWAVGGGGLDLGMEIWLAACVYVLPDEVMTGHSTGTGKKISPHCMMIGVYIHTISHWLYCRCAVALLICMVAMRSVHPPASAHR